jgi:hypothetical protein
VLWVGHPPAQDWGVVNVGSTGGVISRVVLVSILP